MSRAINPTISKRQVGFIIVSSFCLFERFLVRKSRTTDTTNHYGTGLHFVVHSRQARESNKQTLRLQEVGTDTTETQYQEVSMKTRALL
jgi:hypothetical protein